MAQYPTGPPICGTPSDPTCRVRINSALDLGLVIVYAFWGLNLLSFSIFAIAKRRSLKLHPVHSFIVTQSTAAAQNASATGKKDGEKERGEEIRVAMEVEKEIRFTGYMCTFFGEYCWYLALLTSLHWIVLWMVLLLDTYNKCEVRGIDSLCFYGNYFIFGTYDFNGTVYFVLWWLMGIWFTVWMLNRDQVHNWFRSPCTLSKAQLVHVWAPHQQEILCSDASFLVHQARTLKGLVVPADRQGHSDTLEILRTKSGTSYVIFQAQRFLFAGDSLYQAHYEVGNNYAAFLERSGGLSTDEAEARLEELGPNEIPFRAESFWFTVYDEVFTLFHAYQVIMYMNYLWLAYLFIAVILISVVLLSACVTIFTRRRSQLAIAKISEYKTQAVVMRNGKWITIESRDMVPGDVAKIKSDWLLPCDLVIIRGFCICDESSLTGESMPVQKYAANNSQDAYDPQGRGSRHTLFSGATVLQAGTCPSDEVLGVVSATGMATSKGALLSSILYPERMVFKYDEELPIVVLSLLCYAAVCFVISLLFQQNNGQKSIWVTKFGYCSAIISQTVSPLLPVALEVGQLHAVDRLKRMGIYCLNPKRIAIAGKIRVFCFDKTGTLTKDGLDFIGVQSSSEVEGHRPSFDNQLFIQTNSQDVNSLTMHGLATCHAVTRFGHQFVGNEVEVYPDSPFGFPTEKGRFLKEISDQLERENFLEHTSVATYVVRMFSETGWDLIESQDNPVVRKGTEELTILKRYEFDHNRATMSVIVEDAEGVCHVYCKGSFEKIGEITDPASLPEDYLHVSRGHALNGCYTLGLSHRNLGKPDNRSDLLSLSRDQLESGLSFVALLMFRNELKGDTLESIEALKDGEVRPLMVTGDNAQTGYYIAKKCGMVEQHVSMILADTNNEGGRVTWSIMGADHDPNQKSMDTQEMQREHQEDLDKGLVELAVTGKAFNALLDCGAMTQLLFYTRIYARFAPGDKVQVVNMHRNRGLVVGMCGDGGNDCGALRSAHAGLALSKTEASVVSPFTSEAKSVSSVVDLLREGRGALHTSFACYKFLIMYGLTFSMLKLACNWYGVIACQMDYLIIDGVAVISLGYSMTLSHPAKKLGKERPTSSLLGPRNVASILGIWFTNAVFLAIALIYMTNSAGYVQWPAKYSAGAAWWTLGDNWESNVIFWTVYLQFVTTAFAFTFGSTFRRSVFLNYFLTAIYAAIVFTVSCVLLLSSNRFTRLFHMASEQFNRPHPENPVWAAYQAHGGMISPAMDFSQRLHLLIIIFASMICIALWSKVAIEGPVARLIGRKFSTPAIKFNL